MAIEAPYSSFKLKNYLIYIVVCIAAGAWMAYDGYFNEKFIEKNTQNYGTEEAVANGTLAFNQKSPFVLAVLAVGFAIRWFTVKDRKVVADDNVVIIADKTIAYDSIEKINKTHFDSKGFFVITYKDADSSESDLKFSDKYYDNLPAILDQIVTKIS